MIITGGNTKKEETSERTGKRPRRSKVERRQIVEETLRAGVSVAVIARQHGVNANQVFQWRKLYHAGLLESEPVGVELLPVRVSEAVSGAARGTHESTSVRRVSGAIHVEIGEARVRIEGTPDPASVRAVIESLRR
jgi:transposase